MTSFTVQTFNGHDTAQPVAAATFVGLQERGPYWSHHPTLRMWYPAGLQEAIGWNPLRFVVEAKGRVRLHDDGRSYGHPNTTPVRYALWARGLLDGRKVAFINTHLINNAWGKAIRGERALRRKLWRKGWQIVQRLARRLRRLGYAVFILGDLNRVLRFWEKLRNVIGRGFDRIVYPTSVEVLDTWTGDPNGSDHAPLFGRFRFKADQ